MLKTETRNIRGIRVEVTQFPAMRAYELQGRVARVVIMGGDTAAMVTSGAMLEQTAGDRQAFAIDLLSNSEALVDGTRYQLNEKDAINAVFGGDVMALNEALAFAVEVNFGEVFPAAFGKKDAKPEAKVTSEST